MTARALRVTVDPEDHPVQTVSGMEGRRMRYSMASLGSCVWGHRSWGRRCVMDGRDENADLLAGQHSSHSHGEWQIQPCQKIAMAEAVVHVVVHVVLAMVMAVVEVMVQWQVVDVTDTRPSSGSGDVQG